MPFTLPKEEKLKSKKQITQLFANGQFVSKYPLTLIYSPNHFTTTSPITVGFSVSKKKFKTAVARNKIKRLMRECYRLQKPTLTTSLNKNYDIMIIFNGTEIPEYEFMHRKTAELFDKWFKLLHK